MNAKNFSVADSAEGSSFMECLPLETSKFQLQICTLNFSNFKSEDSRFEIFNRQIYGGGEGIRTPDPRVANAVLCQLSYTPE